MLDGGLKQSGAMIAVWAGIACQSALPLRTDSATESSAQFTEHERPGDERQRATWSLMDERAMVVLVAIDGVAPRDVFRETGLGPDPERTPPSGRNAPNRSIVW